MVPHMRGQMMTYRRDRRDLIATAAATLTGVTAAVLLVAVIVWWT